MAEKEERILIKKQINHHPPYGGWCGDGKEIVLTRLEALKKMREAVKPYEIGYGEIEDVEYALEDALNALLESDK